VIVRHTVDPKVRIPTVVVALDPATSPGDLNLGAVPERILGVAANVSQKDTWMNCSVTPDVPAGTINLVRQILFRIVKGNGRRRELWMIRAEPFKLIIFGKLAETQRALVTHRDISQERVKT
jgi:hypothetical protein